LKKSMNLWQWHALCRTSSTLLTCRKNTRWNARENIKSDAISQIVFNCANAFHSVFAAVA